MPEFPGFYQKNHHSNSNLYINVLILRTFMFYYISLINKNQMKKLFFYFVVFSCFTLNAQDKQKFKAGAFLKENSLKPEVKTAKSILIVLEGGFDTTPPKATIEKHLVKLFKKAKMNVTITYWDPKIKEFTNPDLKTADFEMACLLSFKYIATLNDQVYSNRQLLSRWKIVCEKGNTAESMGTATIDVYSRKFLFTEDKKTSRLIFNLLTQ